MSAFLEDNALELIERDIEKFNQYLNILKDSTIPVHQKREAALFVKDINDALKAIQGRMNERDFTIFYNYYFENQSWNRIADSLMIGRKTVGRNKKKVLQELCIMRYPDTA